jgi:hypothetical protein
VPASAALSALVSTQINTNFSAAAVVLTLFTLGHILCVRVLRVPLCSVNAAAL